jgi:hypothetical protein
MANVIHIPVNSFKGMLKYVKGWVSGLKDA